MNVVEMNELRVSGKYESIQSTVCNGIRAYVKENYRGPLMGETVQVLYVNFINITRYIYIILHFT